MARPSDMSGNTLRFMVDFEVDEAKKSVREFKSEIEQALGEIEGLSSKVGKSFKTVTESMDEMFETATRHRHRGGGMGAQGEDPFTATGRHMKEMNGDAKLLVDLFRALRNETSSLSNATGTWNRHGSEMDDILKKLAGGAKDTGENLGAIGTILGMIEPKLKKLGIGLAGYFTLRAGKEAVEQAADVETSLLKAGAVIGKTGEQLDTWVSHAKSMIRDIGMAWGKGQDEVAQAVNRMALSGTKDLDIFGKKAIEASYGLEKMADIDPSGAQELFSRLHQEMGLTAQGMDKVLDRLAILNKYGRGGVQGGIELFNQITGEGGAAKAGFGLRAAELTEKYKQQNMPDAEAAARAQKEAGDEMIEVSSRLAMLAKVYQEKGGNPNDIVKMSALFFNRTSQDFQKMMAVMGGAIKGGVPGLGAEIEGQAPNAGPEQVFTAMMKVAKEAPEQFGKMQGELQKIFPFMSPEFFTILRSRGKEIADILARGYDEFGNNSEGFFARTMKDFEGRNKQTFDRLRGIMDATFTAWGDFWGNKFVKPAVEFIDKLLGTKTEAEKAAMSPRELDMYNKQREENLMTLSGAAGAGFLGASGYAGFKALRTGNRIRKAASNLPAELEALKKALSEAGKGSTGEIISDANKSPLILDQFQRPYEKTAEEVVTATRGGLRPPEAVAAETQAFGGGPRGAASAATTTEATAAKVVAKEAAPVATTIAEAGKEAAAIGEGAEAIGFGGKLLKALGPLSKILGVIGIGATGVLSYQEQKAKGKSTEEALGRAAISTAGSFASMEAGAAALAPVGAAIGTMVAPGIGTAIGGAAGGIAGGVAGLFGWNAVGEKLLDKLDESTPTASTAVQAPDGSVVQFTWKETGAPERLNQVQEMFFRWKEVRDNNEKEILTPRIPNTPGIPTVTPEQSALEAAARNKDQTNPIDNQTDNTASNDDSQAFSWKKTFKDVLSGIGNAFLDNPPGPPKPEEKKAALDNIVKSPDEILKSMGLTADPNSAKTQAAESGSSDLSSVIDNGRLKIDSTEIVGALYSTSMNGSMMVVTEIQKMRKDLRETLEAMAPTDTKTSSIKR